MSIPSFSLAGKVAIVTGGREEISRAIALAFAEAGADVAVCDIVVEGSEVEAVVEEIKKLGRRSLAVQTDVTQKTDVDNMVQKVTDELGAIDILVTNVGESARASLLELSEEDWDKVIDTILKGCYLCCQAVGRKMVERKKGNIINSGISNHSWGGPTGIPAFSIAGAGVMMLTRRLARELASYNIRVNAIAIGDVRAEESKDTWSDPEALKKAKTIIPMGRMGVAEDITNIALFLASDLSGFVTGDTIVADGGFNA